MTGASKDRDKGEDEDEDNSWRSEDSKGENEAGRATERSQH